jgi:hypothetical protein
MLLDFLKKFHTDDDGLSSVLIDQSLALKTKENFIHRVQQFSKSQKILDNFLSSKKKRVNLDFRSCKSAEDINAVLSVVELQQEKIDESQKKYLLDEQLHVNKVQGEIEDIEAELKLFAEKLSKLNHIDDSEIERITRKNISNYLENVRVCLRISEKLRFLDQNISQESYEDLATMKSHFLKIPDGMEAKKVLGERLAIIQPKAIAPLKTSLLEDLEKTQRWPCVDLDLLQTSIDSELALKIQRQILNFWAIDESECSSALALPLTESFEEHFGVKNKQTNLRKRPDFAILRMRDILKESAQLLTEWLHADIAHNLSSELQHLLLEGCLRDHFNTIIENNELSSEEVSQYFTTFTDYGASEVLEIFKTQSNALQSLVEGDLRLCMVKLQIAPKQLHVFMPIARDVLVSVASRVQLLSNVEAQNFYKENVNGKLFEFIAGIYKAEWNQITRIDNIPETCRVVNSLETLEKELEEASELRKLKSHMINKIAAHYDDVKNGSSYYGVMFPGVKKNQDRTEEANYLLQGFKKDLLTNAWLELQTKVH